MSAMYFYIGIMHFIDPTYFLNIIPPKTPFKLFAVYFTGVIEIVGAVLILFSKTRRLGAFVLISLLIMVFPANIYIYDSEVPRKILGITRTDAFVRMIFQLPLLIIALWHSKQKASSNLDLLASIIFINGLKKLSPVL